MKNGLLPFAAATLLAACSQSDTSDSASTDAPAMAGTPVTANPNDAGAFVVTLANGHKLLSFSAPDGQAYAGLMTQEPGTWSVEGDKGCVDPAGKDVKFCFTFGPVGEDGSWTDTAEDGTTVKVRRLDKQMVAGNPAIEPGTFLMTFADGKKYLSVWAKDGKRYYAANPQHGTWHVVDGKRCSKGDTDATESCGIPGPVEADGSFTASWNDQKIKVMPIG